MIIDSHCHIHDEKLSTNLDQILERAQKAQISHLITIGCDINTTNAAKNIAEKFSYIYFSAGYHPHDAKYLTPETYEEIKNLAQHPKCRAIGECGLDYYYNHSDHDQQKQAFVSQIKLAQELSLPLVIHLRDAYEDCLSILKSYLKPDHKTVIHCFSGTLKQAQELNNLGCYISISGIITFKKPGELIKVAQEIPLEKLMIETDAPYLAPHPYRGKINEPAFITHTLETIIQARNQPKEQVTKTLFETTKNFFAF